MKFERFQIHNAADEDLGFLFDTQDEAVTQARQLDGPVCVVALTFEYTDSELVWTSTGTDVWPPIVAPHIVYVPINWSETPTCVTCAHTIVGGELIHLQPVRHVTCPDPRPT